MWTQKTPRQMFERDVARERLVEEARALGHAGEDGGLEEHLASEREARRVMSVIALVAVAGLVLLALYALPSVG